MGSVYTQYAYLNDEKFLKEVDELKMRLEYARFTLLSWDNEDDLEEIQGYIQSGNINIDNSSALRRTATLSVVVPEYELSYKTISYKFSLNKKLRLEIGLKNTFNKYVGYDILWFPLGVFVITGINISHSLSGSTISLNLKDKMVLLNGECGGTLPASVTFNEREEQDEEGNWVITNPTIYQIIQELVNHFGGEQIGRILIGDLDTRVKQVVRWGAENPIYLNIVDAATNTANAESIQVEYNESRITNKGGNFKPYKQGEDIGYLYTPFTYPGELIGDAGNSVVDILTKIKDTLGNYEFFYDIDGNFRFQEIKNYLNTTQASTVLTQINRDRTSDTVYNSSNNRDDSASYIVDMGKGKSVYDFSNSDLVINYTNNPDYGNIKNDFIVWGIRKSITGLELPIRYHLAIDKKPALQTHYINVYVDPEDGNAKASKALNEVSINKLVKQKKAQYFLDNANFYIGVFQKAKNHQRKFIDKTQEEIDAFYEWIDTASDADIAIELGEEWVGSDHNMLAAYNKTIDDYITSLTANIQSITSRDWRTELYLQGIESEPLATAYNYYYTELMNEWPKLYDIVGGHGRKGGPGFKDDVVANPLDMDFFLDFIDTEDALSEYSVSNIGRRTKVLVDNSINCIFEPKVNDIVFITAAGEKDLEGRTHEEQKQECLSKHQNYCVLSGEAYQQLVLGGHYNGADVAMKDLLYQYTNYNESISLTCVPIYHLDVNQRISVKDAESGISDDFIIKNISCPLGQSGNMTINANRALTKI